MREPAQYPGESGSLPWWQWALGLVVFLAIVYGIGFAIELIRALATSS